MLKRLKHEIVQGGLVMLEGLVNPRAVYLFYGDYYLAFVLQCYVFYAYPLNAGNLYGAFIVKQQTLLTNSNFNYL